MKKTILLIDAGYLHPILRASFGLLCLPTSFGLLCLPTSFGLLCLPTSLTDTTKIIHNFLI
jgi:hypothetical protein